MQVWSQSHVIGNSKLRTIYLDSGEEEKVKGGGRVGKKVHTLESTKKG